MPHSATLEALADLAEGQWGLFTRRQAESTGMAWTTLARLAKGRVAERVAHGVYRLRGSAPDEHLALRAAWLRLAPETKVWERTPDQGVVSHRSAAALYGLGHLPADVHEFVLPVRRQSRQRDVRLHQGRLGGQGWVRRGGLLVTRPARSVADMLADLEDSEAIAQVISDALRGAHEHPGAVAQAIAPQAARFGLRPDDGVALLDWLLGLSRDPGHSAWLDQARSVSGPDSPDRSSY